MMMMVRLSKPSPEKRRTKKRLTKPLSQGPSVAPAVCSPVANAIVIPIQIDDEQRTCVNLRVAALFFIKMMALSSTTGSHFD
jgi:hypothetical protein